MATELSSFAEQKKAAPNTGGVQAPAPMREKETDAQGRSYATGRRKESVARVWIKPGKGRATVNGDCFLPSRRRSWPRRSLDECVEFSTVASLWAVPDTTRKIDSLPANGSTTVLKTYAENGAAGSDGRSTTTSICSICRR
jgi:hypothetical protein